MSRERLQMLLAAVEKMAGGDLDHRIEVSNEHDDIDALAFAINVIVGELSYGAEQLRHAKEEAERRSTELAQAQQTLIAKDRLATLGQLAGGVAHQIRNPLAVILNATAVLDHKLPEGKFPEVAAVIKIIREEIRHANTIVTALLDYARLRQPAREEVSLVTLLDGVLASTDAIPTNIKVQRIIDERVPLVLVDADQLHDAVLNLVVNAVEAMPEGGKISIELRQEDRDVLIAVSDTGKGIPPELEPKLFQPLHSTKPTGIGLGLVTARTFVEAHGGRTASVPSNAGARFEIRLPLNS